MLFDANPLSLVVVDQRTRRFLAVNDAAVEEYGWTRAEALAKTADELYLPQDLPALAALRQKDGPDTQRTIRGMRAVSS
jgi:PAS domain-containing protein